MTSHFLCTLHSVEACVLMSRIPWHNFRFLSRIESKLHFFQECIVVCIVSLEDISINPHNVPYDQCREIRTEGVGGSKQLDYIIIPASAAIVATVIIAVIIFIACLKTSNKKRKGKVSGKICFLTFCFVFSFLNLKIPELNSLFQILDEKPIHTLSINGVGTLRGAPLASLAHMGLGPMATQKDWDQMSMHSQRTDHSVPRARMYHMNNRGDVVVTCIFRTICDNDNRDFLENRHFWFLELENNIQPETFL